MAGTNVDALTTIDEYLGRSDWRVNANANQGYSLGGMILNVAGTMIANYWLEKCYQPEASVAQSRHARQSTSPQPQGRSSTSWAPCRMSGQVRRHSPPSTPTWRPSFDWTP